MLHGLLVIGLIGGIKKRSSLYFIGLVLRIGKLFLECLTGPSMLTAHYIRMPIIVNAQLYGAITGGLIGFLSITLNATYKGYKNQ